LLWILNFYKLQLNFKDIVWKKYNFFNPKLSNLKIKNLINLKNSSKSNSGPFLFEQLIEGGNSICFQNPASTSELHLS
jgi:hypothetical protein